MSAANSCEAVPTAQAQVLAALVVPALPSLDLVGAGAEGESILPSFFALSEEQWLAAVRETWERLNDAKFFFGDLSFEKAAMVTGKDRKLLVDYARVARRVPKEVRRSDLAFNHHRAVLRLDFAGQIYFLALAAEKHWTVPELQNAVKAATQPSPLSKKAIRRFSIALSAEDG